MNSSLRSGSSEAQSVSLPGSTATPEDLRRSTFWAARVRALAWLITSSAMRLPSSTCWLSHSSKGSRTICATSFTASREISSFFTCPLNWGSSIFTASTKLARDHTSSGTTFKPRWPMACRSMKFLMALYAASRSPATCVPP